VNILNILNKKILPRFKLLNGHFENSLLTPLPPMKKIKKNKKTKQTNQNKTKQKHKNDHSVIKLAISGLFTWCCYPCAVCNLFIYNHAE
jgi:hypothetical protein